MRWLAKVTYRDGAEGLSVEYDFEEFEDLGRLIENGPPWDTIENIEITLSRKVWPGMALGDTPDFPSPSER